MRQFWFDGDAQFAPISTLSGGERRRLQLLLTLIEQPNLLLLDEPTNDLDLDTLPRARGVPRRLARHRRRRQPRPRLPRSHGQRGAGARRQRSSRAWYAAASPDGSRNAPRGHRPARRSPGRPAEPRQHPTANAGVEEEPEHAAPSAGARRSPARRSRRWRGTSVQAELVAGERRPRRIGGGLGAQLGARPTSRSTTPRARWLALAGEAESLGMEF